MNDNIYKFKYQHIGETTYVKIYVLENDEYWLIDTVEEDELEDKMKELNKNKNKN